MIMLSENKELYNCFENGILEMYFKIHAIYELDMSAINGDCFCAAVDIFKPGFTFRIYFKLIDNTIIIVDVDRWFMG